MKTSRLIMLALGFCLALVSPLYATATAFGSAAQSGTAVLIVPATAGSYYTLSYLNVGNPNSTLVYVQFFDAATTGAVTVGTTAPTFWVAVPATANAVSIPFPQGYTFKKGMVIAVTTSPTNSTAPGSPCPVQVFIF